MAADPVLVAETNALFFSNLSRVKPGSMIESAGFEARGYIFWHFGMQKPVSPGGTGVLTCASEQVENLFYRAFLMV